MSRLSHLARGSSSGVVRPLVVTSMVGLLVAVSALVLVSAADPGAARPAAPPSGQGADRVFELRTYTAHDGMLERLHARFRDHTMALFEKHGMTNVAYWRPQDAPASSNTLIYVIAHRDRAAAAASWEAFRADPAWQAAYRASRVDGPLVSQVESVFMDATDYSPMP